MINRKILYGCLLLFCVGLFLITGSLKSQENPHPMRTLLQQEAIVDIVNEISGKLPYNHIVEMGGYNRDRKEAEYSGLYLESKYMVEKAKEYGFSDVHVEHFNPSGRIWDGETGELWLVEPENRLLISYRDMPLCLKRGSLTSDVTAELIDVGTGTGTDDYTGKEIEGNIILAEGNPRRVFTLANRYKAAGVIFYGQPRALDYPDQIVLTWATVPSGESQSVTFAFNIPPRIADRLKKILMSEDRVIVRANVKAGSVNADSEVVTALIPGDGSSEQEIVLCGHLFEGIAKQGAMDNISGCAVILEAGRAMIKLIEEGKLEKPKRSIRFLWMHEYTGTRYYLRKYPEEVENMIAAINLDMVGEDVTKNHNFLNLYRSLDSRASFLNDICQDFFEYTAEMNRDKIGQGLWYKGSLPIIDPNGSMDPFYYNIDAYEGGSDHSVFQEREFGFPGVMFNNWPDMFYHSNQDRPDKSDPTQLKRTVFITLASSYVITSAGKSDIPKLLSLLYSKGQVRIMKDLEKGLKALEESSELQQHYKEVKSSLRGSYVREINNINSVKVLGGENDWIDKTLDNLEESEKETDQKLALFYKMICEKNNISADEPDYTPDEKNAMKITPVSIKGKEKEMVDDGDIRGLSRDTKFELANYIDSGWSVLDIRNSVLSQFGKTDIKNVMNYYKQLEEGGLVKLVEVKKK